MERVVSYGIATVVLLPVAIVFAVVFTTLCLIGEILYKDRPIRPESEEPGLI